ncbi:MAG: amidohydrolase [Parvibaculaceae bacterium]
MIVDASVHVWSGDSSRYPWAPLDNVERPQDDRSAERLIADLDQAGIDGAIAVQPRAYGYDHAYLADVLARHAGRIAGICLVDPHERDAAAALSGLARRGFRGVRLIALADTPDRLAAPHTGAVLTQAAVLGISVSFLVDPPRLAALGGLAAQHPDTTLVVDHLGLCGATTPAPAIADLLALASCANVHLRVSAFTELSAEGFPFPDLQPLIRDAYRAFGAKRLLWGTDYPHALAHGTYRQSLDAMRRHMDFIAPGDLPAILGGNAARMFHLDITSRRQGA